MPGPAGTRATALVATVLAVAASGCGGGDSSARDGVRAYIETANAVQQRAAGEMEKANAAYASYSQGKLSSRRAITELQRAEDAIRDTRAKLAALRAPARARVLRRRLLAVFDGNVRLAQEASQMARYVPAAARARRSATAAGRRLQRELAGASGPDAQSRTLVRYGAALRRAEALLRDLTPPPLLVPTHRAELLRLESGARLARQLRGALTRGDARAVAALLVRFRRQARAPDGQRAVARAAAAAYARRYRRLGGLVVALRREEARLQRRLG